MTATVLRATVPTDILALVGAVAIGGCVAGLLAATPLLLLTSPLVAAGLAAAATLESRVALRVLSRLPEGQARSLLSDLLGRAATVPPAAHAGPLVRASCEAARQLSALELHIAAFDAQDRSSDHSVRWHEAYDRCVHGRDLLTRRLQDASAALSRWQAAQSVGAAENLHELTRELRDAIRYQQEAAQEVEALLA